MIAESPPSPQPVNLHLSHSWGGGLARWISDFAGADAVSKNLILESFGGMECYGVGLQLHEAGSGNLLERWVFQDPISEVRSTHREYQSVLEQVRTRFGIDHIYISSLVGHSLDVFESACEITVIHHDYFPYCPALFLTRGDVCTSCGTDELAACKKAEGHRPKSSTDYYLDLRETLFSVNNRPGVTHVCPSRSVVENLRRIDSRYAEIPFHIIEHGLNYERRDLFGGAEEGRRLRVGILGVLSWNKGAAILKQEFDRLRTIVDFVLIGTHEAGQPFHNRWGAQVQDQYNRDELPAHLDRCQLDMTLFLSLVPETFSFTSLNPGVSAFHRSHARSERLATGSRTDGAVSCSMGTVKRW